MPRYFYSMDKRSS